MPLNHRSSTPRVPSRRRFLAATLLLGGAGAPRAATSGPARTLADLAERYAQARARFSPVMFATAFGDNRFDDQLPVDIAPAQARARVATYRALFAALHRLPREALSADDRLTHDLLHLELDTRLAEERFPGHLLALHQLDSIPNVLAAFATGQADQPLETVAQHEAFLQRLAALPAWTDQAIANLREGVRRGIVHARPVVDALLPQLRSLANPRLADNPYHAAAGHLNADIPPAQRERLQAAYARVVGTQLVPALQRLAEVVEREYRPASRTRVGWNALPGGEAWYRQLVREHTTTTLTPDAIHALGRREVARIQRALAALAPALGYDGPPARLLGWLHDAPRFKPFRSEAEVLDAYRAIDRRVQAALPRLVGRRPRAGLDIRPEPELTRAAASDHYASPAVDGSRPGVFWAVIDDPARYDQPTMTALFLHEAVPGHHLQLALQQELALPTFRQRSEITAYVEGWALYAETLGTELGLYDDPVARAGQLSMEMLRAARLVVDTGLHAGDWTRERALAYLADVAGLTPAMAANETDRYLAWPAQALSYTIGALKIQALRQRAQAALGARFELAAFHDAVLGQGALPLSLLEQRIEAWIAGPG